MMKRSPIPSPQVQDFSLLSRKGKGARFQKEKRGEGKDRASKAMKRDQVGCMAEELNSFKATPLREKKGMNQLSARKEEQGHPQGRKSERSNSFLSRR